MSTKRKTPEGEASDTKTSEASPFTRLRRRKTSKRTDPIRDEVRRQRRESTATARKGLNFAKTFLAAFLWLSATPLQVAAIAPYISYLYAQSVIACIVVMFVILLHLWPTRTPQWRTLFWAFWITGAVGGVCLYLGAGTVSVTLAALASSLFVLIRVNQNGRRIVGMIQDWRMLR